MRNRIILHVDMNSYFASVEQQANPFLRGKPIGITGKPARTNRSDGRQERSVVATASIEAKRLGVKTAMSTWEAERICPSLMLIPGDPEKYSEIMHRFNAIFRAYADRVERFSIDESFLDVTRAARDELGALAIALRIKADLRDRCGERVTASVGIGPNKLLAKLASERVKPDGLTVIRPDEALRFLDASDLEDLCGIGPRIRRRLETLGITDFAKLRHHPLDLLEQEFKSYGRWLHHAAWGRDDSPVTDTEHAPKSIGHSYTLAHDTRDPREMKRYLLGLCDKVAWRLRRDGYIARRIGVHMRYGDFTSDGQEHLFAEPTANGLTIFKSAWNRLERLRDPSKSVRLLGVRGSALAKAAEPQPLFKKDRRMLRVVAALDRIQTRYGAGSWQRAAAMRARFKPRSSGFHFDHEI